MNEKKPKYTIIQQDLSVQEPEDTKCKAIPLSDWKHLVNKIRKISSPKLTWHTIGSIMLGAGLTEFLALLTTSQASHEVITFLWIYASVLTVAGILSLIIASKERKQINVDRDIALEEVERIEQKFEKQD